MGEFAERVKAARLAVGMSPYAVATAAGIDPSNYRQIESGKRPPSQSAIESLATVRELGLTLDDLQLWADIDRLGPDGVRRMRKSIIQRSRQHHRDLSAEVEKLISRLRNEGATLSDEEKAEIAKQVEALVEKMEQDVYKTLTNEAIFPGIADKAAIAYKEGGLKLVDDLVVSTLAAAFQVDEDEIRDAIQKALLSAGDYASDAFTEKFEELLPDVRAIGGRYPLTDEEAAIVQAAHEAGIEWRLDQQVGLLDQPPDERKYVFRNLESFVDSIRLHKRLHG